MSITKHNIRIHAVILLLASLNSIQCFGKDQYGDSFRTALESTFPQREFDSRLNSLQVLANPLFGEPFSLPDSPRELFDLGKFEIGNNDFRNILKVFPEFNTHKSNLRDIDQADLKDATSSVQTWSYHSSPVKSGGLAARYQYPIFQNNARWADVFDEYQNNPPQSLIADDKVNMLSPIEKYEYLIGSTDFPMTKNEWEKGQQYYDRYHEVPYWIGNCHGTAPALINSPRPEKAIKLKSFNKKDDITFYPSDLKKLLAFAWAENSGPSALLGNRCGNVLQPNVRPQLSCLDVNPAAFFLVAVNLLGLHKHPFIIDTSAGSEVWNQTVVSYTYSYFRPGTRNTTDSLKHALIKRTDYKNDPFAAYRSSKATSIVGIWMQISYVNGTKPSAAQIDSAKNDVFEKVSYWFDLELDDSGNLLGGEWQDIKHPDFIWVVAGKYTPLTVNDHIIGTALSDYKGDKPLPRHVSEQAVMAAEQGLIPYRIIEAMLRLAKEEN